MQIHSASKDDDQKTGHNPLDDGTVRVNLTISRKLLKQVDSAAEQDFTSRSDIIRAALLSYLRSAGRTGLDLELTDPDVLLKTLQTRKLKAYLKQHQARDKEV